MSCLSPLPAQNTTFWIGTNTLAHARLLQRTSASQHNTILPGNCSDRCHGNPASSVETPRKDTGNFETPGWGKSDSLQPDDQRSVISEHLCPQFGPLCASSHLSRWHSSCTTQDKFFPFILNSYPPDVHIFFLILLALEDCWNNLTSLKQRFIQMKLYYDIKWL